ncbi:sperm-associated microtubule inner protein 4 [Sminthopsis crassicaudata]|uniref:sperm-associated microtubule inner protein 4 n=1 Tax=Sminthopsis crassicaudata TaxID=9301 RepID=UPI003D69CEB6
MEMCPNLPHYYNQLEGTSILSNTITSNEIHTPLQVPARITASENRYQEFKKSNLVPRLPWGKEREYGAMIPMSLPEEYKPKSGPRFYSKGHKHFGFGGDPWPSGIPIRQFYHLTQNKKSNLYGNDCLLPKPLNTTAEPLRMGFPVEHPYQSHISRSAMFPSFTPPPDMKAGPAESFQQPFPATIGMYRATTVKKTGGNPYRHEILKPPCDPRKKVLYWPGQSTHSNIPKNIHKNTQIYHPKPSKLLTPNNTLVTMDPLLLLKAGRQRVLEQSHWITSYTRDFTGLGSINPFRPVDVLEKEVVTLTDSAPKESGPREFTPTKPLEGRGLQDSTVMEEKFPVHTEPGHAEMMHAKGSPPTGPVPPKDHISETREEMLPAPYAFPICYETKDVFEQGFYPKITDTYKNDALYWRQLCFRPTPQVCIKPEETFYYDNMKPSRLNQYVVWQNPISLSKPSILPERVEPKPPFPPSHLKEPQKSPQMADKGIQEEKEPFLKQPPKAEVLQPQTSLLELQNAFSKTDAHKRLQKSIVEDQKDLRDNKHLGMKHNFYNYNSYYFFN